MTTSLPISFRASQRRAKRLSRPAFLEKTATIDGLREAVSLLRFEHMRGPKTPDGAGALLAVTKPTPDETCGRCGSLLFPPDLAPGMMIPAAADLVCLNCGRAYEWTGTPPRLCVVVPDVESDEDEGD
jgi:hypothetical protein